MSDDPRYWTSASYQMGQVREYRLPAHYLRQPTEDLHSGEYFIEQGERQLARMRWTIYRCVVGAIGVVTAIYCIVKLL